jgi:prepilin-type N-terminal cleavage/methylation domain-containing protein
MLKNKASQRGFTLIELLVVVAIIGLLSSVVLASLSNARAKARDARRLSDLNQINLAIQMYYANKGFFPVCGTLEIFIDNGLTDCLSSALIAEGLMSRLPYDPLYGNNGSANWGFDYGYYSPDGAHYDLRGGFEGTPLKQNSDYPDGATCDSGIYPTCGWTQNCVYKGYGPGSCPLSQSYGE